MKMEAGQFLTFKLDGQCFGLAIKDVREINRMSQISPVPAVPDFVEGVMNLRGKVIPVVNLRKRFNMKLSDYTKETCIMVVESFNGYIGVIVDAVEAVIDLGAHQIDECPTEGELSFVKSIGKLDDRLILLVDITNCIAKTEVEADYFAKAA